MQSSRVPLPPVHTRRAKLATMDSAESVAPALPSRLRPAVQRVADAIATAPILAAHVEVAGSALREAEALVLSALGLPRSALYADPERVLSMAERAKIGSWLARRSAGEPLAYLLGVREFWSLTLEVSPAVLVPRAETELLVERALRVGDEFERRGIALPCALDLGTGSGAIAIALAHERPGWRISAVELSTAALALATRNAERHGLVNLELLEGDWFSPLGERRFHLIVSNPPYVDADDPVLHGDSLRHEPRAALTPGADGFADLRHLIDTAPSHLESGGVLILEHGAAQGAAVRSALVARGFAHVVSHRDLAGHERVTEGSMN